VEVEDRLVERVEGHDAPVHGVCETCTRRHGVELLPEELQAFVELPPRNVVLRSEVAKQCAAANADGISDLLHRRVVKAVQVEEAKRGSLYRSVIRRGGAALESRAGCCHETENLTARGRPFLLAQSAINVCRRSQRAVTPTTGAVMEQKPTTDTTAIDDVELAAADLIEEVSIDGMCGVY
jgi:mycofactocin precursor